MRPDIFELTHEQIQGDRYRRVGEVDARPAVPGEVVETLEGGPRRARTSGSLRGVAGEEWLVSSEHFARTYEPVED